MGDRIDAILVQGRWKLVSVLLFVGLCDNALRNRRMDRKRPIGSSLMLSGT